MVNTGKQFYQDKIEGDLSFLRYLAQDIGEMNRIREMFSGDWKIEELARAIIHDEAQSIEGLKREIENDRETLKELG